MVNEIWSFLIRLEGSSGINFPGPRAKIFLLNFTIRLRY